jgi:hypothetical protein
MDALSTGSPFERVVLMKGAQSPNSFSNLLPPANMIESGIQQS